jgi:hypothetical protein
MICDRVAPELKSQIDSGKIDLTAIVNTHQYGFGFINFEWKCRRLTDHLATGIMPEVMMTW